MSGDFVFFDLLIGQSPGLCEKVVQLTRLTRLFVNLRPAGFVGEVVKQLFIETSGADDGLVHPVQEVGAHDEDHLPAVVELLQLG